MNGYLESPMSEDVPIARVFTGTDVKRKRRRSIKKDELIGKRIGRLVVISFDRKDGYTSWWKCRCDCGKEKILQQSNIISERTISCGCYRDELQTTHGKSSSCEYKTWANMIARCTNPKEHYYANYGGRGITICDRWKNSFEEFYADMGDRPSGNYSIERLDVNGNYEPSNCVWATSFQQQRNIRVQRNNKTGITGVAWVPELKRYTARIKLDGKSKHLGCFVTLSEAAAARRQAEIKYWGKSQSDISGMGKVSNAGLEE